MAELGGGLRNSRRMPAHERMLAGSTTMLVQNLQGEAVDWGRDARNAKNVAESVLDRVRSWCRIFLRAKKPTPPSASSRIGKSTWYVSVRRALQVASGLSSTWHPRREPNFFSSPLAAARAGMSHGWIATGMTPHAHTLSSCPLLGISASADEHPWNLPR